MGTKKQQQQAKGKAKASGSKQDDSGKQTDAEDAQSAKDRKRISKKAAKAAASWSSWGDDLAAELAALGLRIKNITADGNCFFRALGDQLKGDEGLHSELRNKIVTYVQEHEEDYAPFIEDDEPFAKYVSRMKKDGCWAGNIELVAASHTLQVNITVYQAGQPRWTITNFDAAAVPMLHLSYHDGQHYNSVRMATDPGLGPPVPIVISGDGVVTRPAAKPDQGWGDKEVQRVATSTACTDMVLVRSALEEARGNPDLAIEKVIERLAALPDVLEDDQTCKQAEEPQVLAGSMGDNNTLQQQLSHAPDHRQPRSALSGISEEHVLAPAEANLSPAETVSNGICKAALKQDSGSNRQGSDGLQQQQADTAEVPVITIAFQQDTCEGSEGQANGPGSDTKAVTASTDSGKGKKSVKGKRTSGIAVGDKHVRAPARNKDCPCGSKKKYKNCCGAAAAAAARRAAATGTSQPEEPATVSTVVVGKAAQLGAITI